MRRTEGSFTSKSVDRPNDNVMEPERDRESGRESAIRSGGNRE